MNKRSSPRPSQAVSSHDNLSSPPEIGSTSLDIGYGRWISWFCGPMRNLRWCRNWGNTIPSSVQQVPVRGAWVGGGPALVHLILRWHCLYMHYMTSLEKESCSFDKQLPYHSLGVGDCWVLVLNFIQISPLKRIHWFKLDFLWILWCLQPYLYLTYL